MGYVKIALDPFIAIANMEYGKMGEESLMRSRWARKLSSEIPRWYNVRMGKLPDVDMAAAFKVIQGYADLVFIENGIVKIVEFKTRDFRGAIGQLLSYRNQFTKTPEFQPYSNLPIQLVLVASRRDDATRELAESEGIIYELFAQ